MVLSISLSRMWLTNTCQISPLRQEPLKTLSSLTIRVHPTKYHNSDVIMAVMTSQVTSHLIVYLAVYSGADQRKHQNSKSLAFVQGIYRWAVNSPHKWPVMWKIFPFDDVMMMLVVCALLCFVLIWYDTLKPIIYFRIVLLPLGQSYCPCHCASGIMSDVTSACEVSTMAADAMAPFITMSSTAMVSWVTLYTAGQLAHSPAT